jgi:hypothetical protein
MRRVVTGHRNGKSVILEDAEIPAHDMFGNEGTMLWKTEGTPIIPVKEGDLKKHLPFQFPKPRETSLSLAVLPPEKEYLKKAKENGVEIHLKPGDCVVQNGIRHAWRNKSNKNCIMVSVMVGAKRK